MKNAFVPGLFLPVLALVFKRFSLEGAPSACWKVQRLLLAVFNQRNEEEALDIAKFLIFNTQVQN